MTGVRDPDCDEVVEAVTDYLEGAMPDPDREAFERHLAACPGCAAYLEQMRAVVAGLGRVGSEALDPAVRDGLLDAFRGWRDRL